MQQKYTDLWALVLWMSGNLWSAQDIKWNIHMKFNRNSWDWHLKVLKTTSTRSRKDLIFNRASSRKQDNIYFILFTVQSHGAQFYKLILVSNFHMIILNLPISNQNILTTYLFNFKWSNFDSGIIWWKIVEGVWWKWSPKEKHDCQTYMW